jgi:hypothetical protein
MTQPWDLGQPPPAPAPDVGRHVGVLGASALARFEGAPAPEPPGWVEVERAVHGWAYSAGELPGPSSEDPEANDRVDRLLAALRPLFERLAAARLLAEADAARLREALGPRPVIACAEYRGLGRHELGQDDAATAAVRAALAAPPPLDAEAVAALLALPGEWGRYSKEARQAAVAADHEVHPRVGPPEMRAEANAFDIAQTELAAALRRLGLEPEGAGDDQRKEG